MKKICIFVANYLPNIGGIERYTYNLSTELTSLGHQVTIVTSNVFNLPTHENIDGIEIFRLPCYNVMNGRYPIYKKNATFKNIDKELKSRKYDLFIINARFYLHSIYGAKIAYQTNTPCITIEHGSSHLSVNNHFLDFLGELYEHGLTHFLKKYCKNFYGASKACCNWSKHFGINSKGVLYNAINIDEINQLCKNPINYRKKYNINENNIVISFTGRLIKEKGILELIEAIKEINNPNVIFFIAGNGNLSTQIKKMVKNNKNIILLGGLDFINVISLLNITNIFCLPTESESISTSILEAMATKSFVISTKVGGVPEAIISKDFGILTNSNSSNELVSAINYAIANPKYRKDATENSYKRVVNNFTWKITAQKLIDILNSLQKKDDSI